VYEKEIEHLHRLGFVSFEEVDQQLRDGLTFTYFIYPDTEELVLRADLYWEDKEHYNYGYVYGSDASISRFMNDAMIAFGRAVK